MEELRPALVRRQDADVHHVGVRKDDGGVAADRGALVLGRVAVVDRRDDGAQGFSGVGARRRAGGLCRLASFGAGAAPDFPSLCPPPRQRVRTQRGEVAGLVLGQRFGRVEVQRARLRVARRGVERRDDEAERLPARRPRRHDDVPALGEQVVRLALV